MKRLLQVFLLFLCGLTILGSCSIDPQPQVAPPLNPQDTTSFAGVIQDVFEGENIVIYANPRYQTMAAFSRTTEAGKTLEFQPSTSLFPIILEDNEGTKWNIFGEATTGPGAGDKLIPVKHQLGFWFSFSSFFPKVTLYGEPDMERLPSDFTSSEWLINPDDIKKGASKDGIPSIDNPKFDEVDVLNEGQGPYKDTELMIVIQDGSAVKAYPQAILNWHEIVNDVVNDKNVAVSHCPLTGTSSVWDSQIDGQVFEFGVSGFLYNDNLILYDRNTDNLWSQIISESINGSLLVKIPNRENSLEMTWAGVKKLQKQTFVLSKDTGFSRDYDIYPYGDYKSNSNLLFSITYTDDRLHPKERVLAIMLNDKAKIYQFKDFNY